MDECDKYHEGVAKSSQGTGTGLLGTRRGIITAVQCSAVQYRVLIIIEDSMKMGGAGGDFGASQRLTTRWHPARQSSGNPPREGYPTTKSVIRALSFD
eukprot:8925795-Pyramimonas_sp.AAC.1